MSSYYIMLMRVNFFNYLSVRPYWWTLCKKFMCLSFMIKKIQSWLTDERIDSGALVLVRTLKNPWGSEIWAFRYFYYEIYSIAAKFIRVLCYAIKSCIEMKLIKHYTIVKESLWSLISLMKTFDENFIDKITIHRV